MDTIQFQTDVINYLSSILNVCLFISALFSVILGVALFRCLERGKSSKHIW